MIGKAVEKARLTVESNERIEFDKRTYRRVPYFTDLDTGYWNCGSMTYVCQLCSALHYLGEKNSRPGSSLLNPKFSECCASGQVTPRFLLDSVCEQCRMPFNYCQVNGRHLLPEEVCNSCSYVYRKYSRCLSSLMYFSAIF